MDLTTYARVICNFNTDSVTENPTRTYFLHYLCKYDSLSKNHITENYILYACELYSGLLAYFVVWNRKNDIAVVSLSDQKDIALEVTVKNRNGDDAHEAKLMGWFGDSLSYSGFRSQKTTVSSKDTGLHSVKLFGFVKIFVSIISSIKAENEIRKPCFFPL